MELSLELQRNVPHDIWKTIYQPYYSSKSGSLYKTSCLFENGWEKIIDELCKQVSF